ncbi:MAG: GGDEF domain-containing protein [Lachnospiraceae bacterium]|nr:GGDEF domain-containing protein [Lachnospiraceae bacterium]
MKNKRIAVFANGWSCDNNRSIINGLVESAKADGVDIFIYTTYIRWAEDPVQGKSRLNIFHLPDPELYDGAIMLKNTFNIPDESERIVNVFHKKGVPMISIEIPEEGMAFVGSDNYNGMFELTNHLIEEHGVKNVVFISGIEGNEECIVREMAAEDALKDHGLTLQEKVYFGYEFYKASVESEVWATGEKPMPDAFICANDHMALGLIATFQKHGIEVPEQVIVTGFDHIYEARTAAPILATVSRQWDEMGEELYRELMSQIEQPNPFYRKIYRTNFVPSESCGCKPTESDKEIRIKRIRNLYSESTKVDITNLFIQELGFNLSKIERKEEFFEPAHRIWEHHPEQLGKNFCICTEPLFFELDDESYPERIRGYSDEMDVIYGQKDGEGIPLHTFATKEVYPGYEHKEGESNVYVITPLNYMEYIIGYVAVKNEPEVLHDLRLMRCVSGLNMLFVMARRHIFAQQTNRKLEEIYMMDENSGMYNRTGCEKMLYPFLFNGKRDGKKMLLLFVDIDNMKTINDEFGHLNGDLAIKATAYAMRNALPSDWILCRYGGDEFLAGGVFDEDGAYYKAKIEEAFDAIKEGLRIAFDLSISIGYYEIDPKDEQSVDDYIRLADEAMYEEKKKHHEG